MFLRGMLSCVTLLLLFSTCVHINMAKTVREKRNTCVYKQHINGCSTPTGYEPYRDEFTPACNIHDVCYFCGTKYGMSRKLCDDEFRQEMYNICDSSKRSLCGAVTNLLSGNTCKAAADVYYTAVDNFAAGHYVNPSPSWCEDTCVQDFLDDYFNLSV